MQYDFYLSIVFGFPIVLGLSIVLGLLMILDYMLVFVNCVCGSVQSKLKKLHASLCKLCV